MCGPPAMRENVTKICGGEGFRVPGFGVWGLDGLDLRLDVRSVYRSVTVGC